MHAATNSCINKNNYQLIAYELRASLYRYTFMNTDMNQHEIFRKCMGMLIDYCKRNDSLSAESLVLGKLTRHLCLQSTLLAIYLFIWYVRPLFPPVGY